MTILAVGYQCEDFTCQSAIQPEMHGEGIGESRRDGRRNQVMVNLRGEEPGSITLAVQCKALFVI